MTVHYEIPVEKVPVECERCGRELPSHHLGCADAHQVEVPQEAYCCGNPEPHDHLVGEDDDPDVPVCQAEGCQDAPKPYGGRGPRPKFCAAHGK